MRARRLGSHDPRTRGPADEILEKGSGFAERIGAAQGAPFRTLTFDDRTFPDFDRKSLSQIGAPAAIFNAGLTNARPYCRTCAPFRLVQRPRSVEKTAPGDAAFPFNHG